MDKEIAISVPELAKRLSISKGGAYVLVKQKDFFPAFHLGNRILVSVDKLNEWVRVQTQKGEMTHDIST